MPSNNGETYYDLYPIFHPRSIVVVGLSSRDPNHPANVMFSKNLMEMKTKTYGIASRSDNINGNDVYNSISQLPEVPDLAVVAVSAKNVKNVIKEAAEFGIKGAIIVSGGFSETNTKEGKQLQDELVKMCIDYNMPFLGPNCFGIYSPPLIDTLFLPSERLIKPKEGNIAVITQSGGVLIDQFFINCAERNIGISSAVSIGNKAMINEAILLKYFETDKNTDVMAFYLEGFNEGEGRKFIEQARNSRKDVVVYTGGMSTSGKEAVKSHTGSLAVNSSIIRGAFKQYSIINPTSEQELTTSLKMFSMMANPFRKYSTMAIRGDRIAVLTVSGGHGVLCSDLLEKYGLGLAKITDKQKEEIAFLLNPVAAKLAALNNPIDITGSGTDDDIVKVLEYLFKAPNIEMILMLLVPQVPQLTMNLGRAIHRVSNKYTKPFIAYVPWTPKYNLIRDALELQHIPCGHTIEETVLMANAIKLKGEGGIRKKFSWNVKM